MSAPTAPRSTTGENGVGPVACRSCDLHEVCRLSALIAMESGQRRLATGALRKVRAGEALFRSGAAANSLYAVRQGMLKTVCTSSDGEERILALHTPGEVLGLDAFNAGTYTCDAVALQPSVCCELPLPLLGEYGARVQELGSALIRLLSGATAPRVNLSRGSIRQRVSRFLLDLALRLERRDLDGRRFTVGLSRQEIANLLDTRIETVSRMLQQMHREQLIRLRGDHVSLITLEAVGESAGTD